MAATVKRLFTEYAISYSTSFFGFLIIMLTARMLGAEQFAWVAAGVAFGGFFIPLTTLGSDLTFVRDAVAARDRDAVWQMAVTTFGMRVTVAAAISVLLFLFAPFYAHSLENGLATALLATWAGMQGLYAMSWFDYLGKTRQQNIIVLMERIGSLTVILCMFALPHYLHRAIVAGLILSLARLLSVIGQVSSWNAVIDGRKWVIPLRLPRGNPGINLRVTAASVAAAAMIYGNQLFLGGSKIELASYGLCFQIVGLILIFQNQTNRLVSRKIAETCRRGDRIIHSTVKYALFMAGGSAALALVGLALMEMLPALLADPRYEAAKKFAPMLCVWVVVAGAANSVVQHLLSCNRESFYLGTSIASGISTLALGALFIPQYGGLAVAAILIGGQTAMMAVNFCKIIAIAGHRAARIGPA